MNVNDARREEVVAAFEAGDELAVRRLGWQDVWEAADQWWRPRQACSMKQFVWYAKLLGAEDPAKVLEAFTDLCGEYRPTPAHVRGHLHRPKDAAEPERNGPSRNPFSRPRPSRRSLTRSRQASANASAAASIRRGSNTTRRACCAAVTATGSSSARSTRPRTPSYPPAERSTDDHPPHGARGRGVRILSIVACGSPAELLVRQAGQPVPVEEVAARLGSYGIDVDRARAGVQLAVIVGRLEGSADEDGNTCVRVPTKRAVA
jgi:hypothetical protein